MDILFGALGWVDAMRVVDHCSGKYTWWSNRGQSWENNVGWRIDYQVVIPSLTHKILAAAIYRKRRFSDHAPLIIDYDQPF